MAMKNGYPLALALLTFLAGPAAASTAAHSAPPQAAAAQQAQGYQVDRFDVSIERWRKSQALYWRRQQYAHITPLAGTKAYYRKADLIEAQMHITYAGVDLAINQNVKQALSQLDQAKSLIKSGEKGAGQDELTEIGQVTRELDKIKSEINPEPPIAAHNKDPRKRLLGVALALRHIVMPPGG